MSSVLGKRAWEPGAAPEGVPPAQSMEQSAVAPAADAAAPPPADEQQALTGEAAWLRQQNATLQHQLAQLQQQHQSLMQHQQQMGNPYGAPRPAAPAAPHNPTWTEQTNPENGQVYYWNSATGESTYSKPADFNPPSAAGAAALGQPMSNQKGPPGANLFVVRKMRRGEYDAFNEQDLRMEFSRYGTVTRAEITIDKETGWSKGAPPSRRTHPQCVTAR